MPRSSNLGILFLHALPLDGSMWTSQMDALPGASYAPTLYGLGNTIEEWATEVLNRVTSDRLVVVGCSVGGSCALEVAVAAPERVAALVLIGTKAKHRPEPELHRSALDLIEKEGVGRAWDRYWGPLFSKSTDPEIVEAAQRSAHGLPHEDIACGVTAFHTRQSRDQFVSECQIPITVVTGEDDVTPGVKVSAALAASAAQGRLHVIPYCGHYVSLEQPDALTAILSDVIETQA